MRYYNGHLQKKFMRGSGHCCMIQKPAMSGEGIISDLVYEGLSMAKKYVTPDNLRRVGRKVLTILKNEGEELLRKEASKLIEKGTEKSKKIAEDILKGKPLKEIGKETKQDLKEAIVELKQKAPGKIKDAIDRAEQRVFDTYVTQEEEPPPLSDVIGSGMMVHNKKKKKMKGKGIKRV